MGKIIQLRMIALSFLTSFAFWGLESMIIPHNFFGSIEASILACGAAFTINFFWGFASGLVVDRYFKEFYLGIVGALGIFASSFFLLKQVWSAAISCLCVSCALINSLKQKTISICHKDKALDDNIFMHSFVANNIGAVSGQMLFGLSSPSFCYLYIMITALMVILIYSITPNYKFSAKQLTKFVAGFSLSLALGFAVYSSLSSLNWELESKIIGLVIIIIAVFLSGLSRSTLKKILFISFLSLSFYSIFLQLHGYIYSNYSSWSGKINFLPDSFILSVEPVAVSLIGIFMWGKSAITKNMKSVFFILLVGLFSMHFGMSSGANYLVFVGPIILGLSEYIFSPEISRRISLISNKDNAGVLYGFNSALTSISGGVSATIGNYILSSGEDNISQIILFIILMFATYFIFSFFYEQRVTHQT